MALDTDIHAAWRLYDKLKMNGNKLILFMVGLPNHERKWFVQRFPSEVVEDGRLALVAGRIIKDVLMFK